MSSEYHDQPQPIVPGITVDSAGQATVSPDVAELLFELAIELEGPTGLPVDVEHVLAAIVLAVRTNELDRQVALRRDDPLLLATLAKHVRTVFAQFGGKLGRED